MIINVGCGMTPVPGALNLDNSFSVYLAHHKLLFGLLKTLKLLSPENLACAEFSRQHGIEHMNGTRMELPDNYIDVVYSSHMLEHLTREQAKKFLAEARRVLTPDGVLRLVLPDMRLLIDAYRDDHDCDKLMERMLLSNETENTFGARLKLALFGFRGLRWMYDIPSIVALLADTGFTDIRPLAPGETTIADPGGLDLFERADESLYVEARPAK